MDLGFFPTIKVDTAAGKGKHQLLQGEICKGEEENRMGEKWDNKVPGQDGSPWSIGKSNGLTYGITM